MRWTRTVVYIAAFGVGLVVSPSLFRYLSQPPARPLRTVIRSPQVVAPVRPHSDSVPPAPPSTAGPPLDGTGGLKSDAALPAPLLTAGPPPARAGASASTANTLRRAAPSAESSHVLAARRPASRFVPPRNPAPQPAPPQQPSHVAAPPRADTAEPPDDQPSPVVVIPAPDTPQPGGNQQTTSETPRFHVQVGMFKVQAEADALVRRLQAAGYVATASAAGDGYRVFVGGYFDRQIADRLATTLRKAGFQAVLIP